MKFNYLTLLSTICLLAFASCGKEEGGSASGYENPLKGVKLPDPTVLKVGDTFYAMGSNEINPRIPLYSSKDLVNWQSEGSVFSVKPAWNGEKNPGLWAPDFEYIGGKYICYYTLEGNRDRPYNYGIGAAVANSPKGPFKDSGRILTGADVNIEYCIDPYVIEDGGKVWLFFGSYFGIWGIELESDGLSLKDGAKPTRIAGTDGFGIEATYIHKRGNYYYLFVSEGGMDYELRRYNIAVGRSENLFGPYVNKDGGRMLNNKITSILKGDNNFYCPGHNSKIYTDNAGQDWILYHCFLPDRQAEGRFTILDRVNWDSEGWPSIGENGAPTAKSDISPKF